ncbi:MAG TPA: GNAT family N-acetyltransferase [Rubricoccaceae bacterium]|jgi:GNAT superfamily N-acetyltransferase
MSAEVHYAVAPITAADAEARFAGLLAPTLASRRRQGPVAEHLVAAVASRSGQAVGVGLAQVRPGTTSGEVLALGVVPEARRQGIGAGLLSRLETAVADSGCPAVQGAYRDDWTGVDAVVGLLDAAGWDAPVVQKLYYKVPPGAFMSRAGFEAVRPPDGYTITDWASLSDADRAHVEAIVAADPATRAVSPFQHPGVVSPELSVWLRHGDEIVGWFLILIPSPVAVEYAGLYVVPEHRRSGAGLALIAACSARHFAALEDDGPRVPANSLFAVEPHAREIQAFAQAYLERPGITKTTVWLAGKRLGAG